MENKDSLECWHPNFIYIQCKKNQSVLNLISSQIMSYIPLQNANLLHVGYLIWPQTPFLAKRIKSWYPEPLIPVQGAKPHSKLNLTTLTWHKWMIWIIFSLNLVFHLLHDGICRLSKFPTKANKVAHIYPLSFTNFHCKTSEDTKDFTDPSQNPGFLWCQNFGCSKHLYRSEDFTRNAP